MEEGKVDPPRQGGLATAIKAGSLADDGILVLKIKQEAAKKR
jgi:flavin-dependent dehydrogenase